MTKECLTIIKKLQHSTLYWKKKLIECQLLSFAFFCYNMSYIESKV